MAEARPMHSSGVRQGLSNGCKKLPVKELSPSTRNFLSRWLNPPTDGMNADFIHQNWMGLAEIINFSNQEIQNFETSKKGPTEALLQAYSTKRNASVGKLWHYLIELERYDILEEDIFIQKLEQDFTNFQLREEEREQNEAHLRAQAEQSRPVQVHNVTSDTFEEDEDWDKIDAETDQYEQMVVDDVNTGKTTYFDAFVSYCHDDLPFVQEMIRMLETVHGLKLCVNARDLLAGGSKHFITARLIADRCRKVILVMSPSFLRSPECEFQVKVALSLSPGAKRKILIPILFKYCKMPLVLQHVCLVDYTKSDLAEWFWSRLAASLKESRRHQRLIPPEELNSLEAVTYDLDYDYKTSNRPDINTLDVGKEDSQDILQNQANHFGWGMIDNDDLFMKSGSDSSIPYDNDQTATKILDDSGPSISARKLQSNPPQNMMTMSSDSPAQKQMTSSSASQSSCYSYPGNSLTSTDSSQSSGKKSLTEKDEQGPPLTLNNLYLDRGKEPDLQQQTGTTLLPELDFVSIPSMDFQVHHNNSENPSIISESSYTSKDFQFGRSSESSSNSSRLNSNANSSLLPDHSVLYCDENYYDDLRICPNTSAFMMAEEQDSDNKSDSLPEVDSSKISNLFPQLPPFNSSGGSSNA